MKIKRVYHPWDVWECYKSGFYNEKPPKGITEEKAVQQYIDFFKNISLFDCMITKVFTQWKKSCEQFLTNHSINRVAWLGQASVFIYCGIPCKYKSAFYSLTNKQQLEANKLAKDRIEDWELEFYNKYNEKITMWLK